MKNRINAVDIIIWIVLAFVAFTCLAPILNTFAISLSDKTSVSVGLVTFWPVGFNSAAYTSMMQDTQFFRSFFNSVVRVLIGGALNVFLCIITAYPLSKDKRFFHSRNIYMWFVVFTMLFYGGLVPSYLVVNSLGIIDSIWALVLPSAVPVFSVIILMNFYKGIPSALEEAAKIDGASQIYILFNIFVPLAKASIATIALFSIVNHWNSYFDGKIYINTPAKMPLQTYIQYLNAKLNPMELQSMTPQQIKDRLEMSDLTFNSAKAMVSMIPIILIYPFLQKYFVTGIVMGAVKE